MPDDDAELVKAGVQGMVEGSLKPFSDLLQALFGPAAAEAGLMFKDSVQHYRRMRRIRFLQRTQEVLYGAKIYPGRVSLKLLVPIIESASNEENDYLQDRWAYLLANAASPADTSPVHPIFPTILKDLTARDVTFLDALFTTALRLRGDYPRVGVNEVTIDPRMIYDIYSKAGLLQKSGDISSRDRNDAKMSMNTFGRQAIIEKEFGMVRDSGNPPDVGYGYRFTRLGASFVTACRIPGRSE